VVRGRPNRARYQLRYTPMVSSLAGVEGIVQDQFWQGLVEVIGTKIRTLQGYITIPQLVG